MVKQYVFYARDVKVCFKLCSYCKCDISAFASFVSSPNLSLMFEMQQNSINFHGVNRKGECRIEHVQAVTYLMFYVSLSMHCLVHRETIERLTSPRENYPLLSAPSTLRLGVSFC